MDTITTLFLIVSSSNLLITRTGIKSQRSSNSGHIHLSIDFGVTYLVRSDMVRYGPLVWRKSQIGDAESGGDI